MKELYATIDIGSNSFHMLTAAIEFDEIKILDSVSEKVMLAEGLSKRNGITKEAQARGLDCISRVAQRLQSIPRQNIRIVGTNTLRAAKNAEAYVESLEEHLDGISIDIISGIEEARLIFLGVSHSWSSLNSKVNNLVIDIGGGSTEFIIGKQFSLKQADSLRLGCVAYRRYFPNDEISSSFFDNAVKAAELELANIKKDFPSRSWNNVIGSAGTFKAIERLAIEMNFSDEGITLKSLYQIKSCLLEFPDMASIKLDGLKALREKTILPGLAITIAIFNSLSIKHMHISRGGLREGILYDLFGRHKAEDIRERTIEALTKRYRVSQARKNLYLSISEKLLQNLNGSAIKLLSKEQLKYLDWAVQSSRIGLAISHSQYQNHSAYLIKNSELSGFTLLERTTLSALVKNHRRKLRLDNLDKIARIKKQKMGFVLIIFLLRLTHIIGQNGRRNDCKEFNLTFDDELEIIIHKRWVKNHSLIMKTLENEQLFWDKAGYRLTIEVID